MSASSPLTDRNLLFGLLALQMDFLSRDQLVEAMNAWMLQKQTSLGEILCRRGVLDEDDRADLEKLVGKHIRRHGGEAQMSLAALRVEAGVRESLSHLGDPDLASSLAPPTTPPADTSIPPTAAPTDIPPPLSASRDFGRMRYVRLRPHAKGGLGEVHVARDEELKREVALKEIQDRFADHPDSRSRFVREAEITGNLEHPGVVPIYGLGVYADGRPYYAMRFIRGESMHEAISRFHKADEAKRDPGERSIALRGLLDRFIAVCNAMAYAHSRGVIHRDIKPANVMLGEYGETLVVDWGLARLVDQADPEATAAAVPMGLSSGGSTATEMGQIVGTPAFMSPEQAHGRQDQVGTSSDVYALGALLYAVLTGKPPYAGASPAEMVGQAQRAEVVPARKRKPGVPRALEAVCAKAMAAAPADRYSNPRELAEEVRRWLADEPVTAHREPLADRLRRWGRRNRTLVASGVVLLAAGVVGLALGLWAVRHEQVKTAKQRDLAEENLELAEKNLKLARKAVDDTFGLAREDPLLQRENMRPVRKLLLEKVLHYYENFRSQKPDERELAAEQADYLYRVGLITAEVGGRAEAIKSYEQARDILQDLVKADPEAARYRAGLADTYNNLGVLYGDTGKLGEALRNHERGRDLRLALVRDHPKEAGFRADLAESYTNLGTLHAAAGKVKRALDDYSEALKVYRELDKVPHSDARFRAAHASTHHNVGNLQGDIGRPREALASYRQAAEIREALRKEHPTVADYRAAVANTENSLGLLHNALGKPREGLKLCEQARQTYEQLSDAHPEVAAYRAGLAMTWNNLASLYFLTGKRDESMKAQQRALDLRLALHKAEPTVTKYHADVADSFALLGTLQSAAGKRQEARQNVEEARKHYTALADAHPEVPRYRAQLADMLALRAHLPGGSRQDVRKARTIYAGLSADHPEVSRYRLNLAMLHNAVGLSQAGEQRPNEALKTSDEALLLLADLIKEEPENPLYQQHLRNTYGFRVIALGQLRRYREEAADYDTLIRMEPQPFLRDFYRHYRSSALARAGEYRPAVELAEELLRGAGAMRGQLAGVFAVSSDAAAKDASRPLPVREKDSEAWARRAVALLRQAADAGEYRDPNQVKWLDKNPDLASLRDRDDYRAFRKSLER